MLYPQGPEDDEDDDGMPRGNVTGCDDDDFEGEPVDFEDSTADWADEIDAVDQFDIEYDR